MLFCNSKTLSDVKKTNWAISYSCKICGHVFLTEEASEDFNSGKFSGRDKYIIRIWLRNEYERYNRPLLKPLTLENLHQIVKQYTPLSPLDKMDNALLIIKRESFFVGRDIYINTEIDYPYFHCFDKQELESILVLLQEEGYIKTPLNASARSGYLSISAKGYKRLRELEVPGKDSRQCFVAMWFAPEMANVYEKAIKPAIEYIEEGKTEPRFHAIKIDNVEHINDINDEIIAAIRRSRFMVCDLTGYRGGIYFEAGFAYGLGLDIIYTCRKDWIQPEVLRTKDHKEIKILYDSNGKEIEIIKEGIHFDIEHRNRIEWHENGLDEFKDKLENRIKAVIL